jgi:hypothetical protein
MQPINLVHTLKGYTSGWVALSEDNQKVLLSGKTFFSLMKKVEKTKLTNEVVLFSLKKNYRGFIGVNLQ